MQRPPFGQATFGSFRAESRLLCGRNRPFFCMARILTHIKLYFETRLFYLPGTVYFSSMVSRSSARIIRIEKSEYALIPWTEASSSEYSSRG